MHRSDFRWQFPPHGLTIRYAARAVLPLLLLVAGWSPGALCADKPEKGKTAAELLPPTTALYLEVPRPEMLLTTLREHPLRSRIESLDVVKLAKEGKPYLDFRAGVAIVESQLALPWYKLLPRVAGGGVFLGLDSASQGYAVLVQATDEAMPRKLIETLVQLARSDAAAKGKSSPIRVGDHRGIPAYELGQAKAAVMGGWLLVTNHEALGRQIIDRWLDPPASCLGNQEPFREVRARAEPLRTAWGYVDLAQLRNAGAARQVLEGKADNPLGELLVGGILTVLPHAPYATLSLALDDRRLQVAATSPFDRAWIGEPREHFFGPSGSGTAPPLLDTDQVLLTLSAYRDISAMWLRAGDLFDAKANEELAKADSNLATLFGGKDFGEDILGAIRPEIQFVVSRQAFPANQPSPAIKLPSFALSAELREPEKMQPELRRTFQSLIGFLNIVGAMNGQPQFDQEMEKTETAQLLIARYLPSSQARDPLGLKIHYNFSPTVAFAGRRLVIASSEQLARRLLAAPAPAAEAPPAPRVANTLAEARFEALREILADNRGQLVAQNMLEEGHTKEEAEKTIELLLELIGWLDRAVLKLDSSPSDLQLTLDVGVRSQSRN